MTRKSLKDKDITIDRIRKRLCDIAQLIKINNKINLTDINIICEELFGTILNRLYDLHLVSLSAGNHGGYVAVDLVDEENRVAYQVTTRNDRKKIKETISKFNKSIEEFKSVDNVYFLILSTEKHSYRAPDTIKLSNGDLFSFKKGVINFNDLICDIENKSSKDGKLLVDIYEIINMLYDTGRLSYSRITQETNELSISTCVNSGHHEHWKKGYGDVELYGFLPVDYADKLSCLIEMRKKDISGIYLNIEHEKLIEDYFVDEETFERKHHVGREEDEDEMYMQIENARFCINAYTAHHIFLLFKEFQRAYEVKKQQIEEIMGAVGFNRRGEAYIISQIDINQWYEVLDFARNHDWSRNDDNNEWNIFNSTFREDAITLSPNMHGEKSAYIIANIEVRSQEGFLDKLDVLWRPGHKDGVMGMVGFDKGIIWKADYTKKWFEEELLPRAHDYANGRGKNKTFFQVLSFFR